MGSPAAALGRILDLANSVRTDLTGNLVLTAASPQVQMLNPNSGNRDVTLPALAVSEGLAFVIVNLGTTNNTLVIKTPVGPTTLATLARYASCVAICDGAGWTVILGAAATVQT